MNDEQELYEAFPDLPTFDTYPVEQYVRWEEEQARPALEAAGWQVGTFRTLEGDSFGPLSRGVICTRGEERVRFWYG